MSSIFKIGEYQKLQLVRKVPMGVYLTLPETFRDADDAKELVLLPKKEVPEDACMDDLIDVFVYKDSEDRPIATTKKPALTLGEFAYLKVVQVTPIGAFLSWGLLKDLFLPFKEQTYRVKEGDMILVSLYLDKSQRLSATMRLYNLLSTDSDYKNEDSVTGTVYELSDKYGAFVAVDNKYSALIPRDELFRDLYIGERIHARVKEVKSDGKLTLSIREKIQFQMDKDSKNIMDKLEAAGGFLPYHDKSSPESIKNEFAMSKASFKRAIGRLYKEKKITISDSGIRLHKV